MPWIQLTVAFGCCYCCRGSGGPRCVSKPLLATRPGCAAEARTFSWQAGGVQPGHVVIWTSSWWLPDRKCCWGQRGTGIPASTLASKFAFSPSSYPTKRSLCSHRAFPKAARTPASFCVAEPCLLKLPPGRGDGSQLQLWVWRQRNVLNTAVQSQEPAWMRVFGVGAGSPTFPCSPYFVSHILHPPPRRADAVPCFRHVSELYQSPPEAKGLTHSSALSKVLVRPVINSKFWHLTHVVLFAHV